jgi:hypothetical protein
MKRFLILSGLVAVLVLGFVLVPVHSTNVFADAQSDICNGIGAASGGSGCATTSGPSLSTIIATIVNILSLIVGIASVIMIMVGGFQYVTSGGDSGKIASGKNTVIYAIVGLLIVAFSQAIVQFVLHKAGI